MACHEIAALRLGLMRILGREDEAERQHELAELGDAVKSPGPIKALCEARDFATMHRLFAASLAELEHKVATTSSNDAKLPYLRSLVILSKKTELDLQNQADNLTRFYRELEEMHDFVHEIYPAG
ncbi:MAG TPA: DUF3209 family protein [Polyangiaceae bacterium]|jgi:hypothetical protein|nr:DUF3209 family protein [Polyangiaceae bacterium]